MSISAIGLDDRGELLYRTALLRRRWTKPDIFATAGLTAEEGADTVSNLLDLGVISQSHDVVGAIRAVEPAVSLPGVAAKRLRAVGPNEVLQGLPVPAAVERFIALHEKSDRRLVDEGDLHSVDRACSVIERLIAHTRTSVTFLVPAYAPDGPQLSMPILEAVLRRGISVTTIWSADILQRPGMMEHARKMSDVGCPPEVVPAVPVSCVLLDDDVAVTLPVDQPPRVIRSAEQIERLMGLKHRLVEQSVPISCLSKTPAQSHERPRGELVLRLLADGLTDDAMARKLGCSVRTIRNEVSCTMRALDARSRFQAGMKALQVGLL